MHVAYMCVIVCVGCGVYVPASVCVWGGVVRRLGEKDSGYEIIKGCDKHWLGII